jgi:hypothetical protein
MTAVSFQGHQFAMAGVLMFWMLKVKEPNPIVVLTKYWLGVQQ